MMNKEEKRMPKWFKLFFNEINEPKLQIELSNMNEPNYYAMNGLSPLKAMKNGLISHEEYIGFLKGNVIKYTVRAGHKDNAIEDINKAIDYLNYLKKEYGKCEEWGHYE